MFKRHRRLDLALKLSSVILTTTRAVVGTITLNLMILAGVGGTGVLLQTITTHKNFSKKKTRLVDMLSNLTRNYSII